MDKNNFIEKKDMLMDELIVCLVLQVSVSGFTLNSVLKRVFENDTTYLFFPTIICTICSYSSFKTYKEIKKN